MTIILKTITAMLFLLLIPLSSYAQENCISNSELLNVAVEEIPNVTPCSMIGEQYVISFVSLTSPRDVITVDPDFPYYSVFRTFLRSYDPTQRTWRPDRFALLLSVVPLMDNPYITADRNRRIRSAAYYAFFLAQFYSAYRGEMGAAGGSLAEQFGLLLTLAEMDSFAEVDCFVLYDIPTENPLAITSSRQFRQCLER